MGNRIVSVRLEDGLWEKLRDLANHEGRTLPGQIHYMVRRTMELKEQNQASAQKRKQRNA